MEELSRKEVELRLNALPSIKRDCVEQYASRMLDYKVSRLKIGLQESNLEDVTKLWLYSCLVALVRHGLIKSEETISENEIVQLKGFANENHATLTPLAINLFNHLFQQSLKLT